jgi:hypothetical protein
MRNTLTLALYRIHHKCHGENIKTLPSKRQMKGDVLPEAGTLNTNKLQQAVT